MKLKSIITISGRISSGKSYAANIIKTKFGLPVASFGGYLRFYCEQNNLPTDRKSLQDTGEIFINVNPKLFLIDVISHYIERTDKIILEGIRHSSILEVIDQLTENRLAIFIEADLQTRYDRYLKRNKDSDDLRSFDQFVIIDNHSVELEIEALKPLCNLVIDSTTDYSSELLFFLSQNLKQ
jgi:dephospho-CoA kinase